MLPEATQCCQRREYERRIIDAISDLDIVVGVRSMNLSSS
jgi:hypothetical protein